MIVIGCSISSQFTFGRKNEATVKQTTSTSKVVQPIGSTSDLCDVKMVRSMPCSVKIEFESERYCKLFPQAHVTVKNDPDIRAVIQAKCPELLGKSLNQLIQEDL
jgi:hypothetical protein